MTFRLGGYGIEYGGDPEAYARAHVEFGYNAAYMPNIKLENRDEIAALVKSFAAADLVIAEGGAWKNLIARDDVTRKANLEYAMHQLALGDELGAGAIVAYHGTVGHPGDPWQLSDNYDYGPHPDNQSEAGFQRAVDTARYVIDMVKPKRTKFSLEMVPWLVTDTPENYLKLLKAIDRPQFGAHIDAANMVISPRLYFNTGKMIQDCFALLGPWIVSCHAKDLVMKGGPGTISFHLDEVVPGEGNLDYTAYITEIAKLQREVPLMLEHFDVPGYRRGLAHIKTVARAAGVIRW
ncbi:sugar phosphate isomerase/epimerase [Rhizobium sophorae]|uniref:Sugar phosphate isomerase/epimerase n=2 Tax=Rhizobium sophorae TaxID=1535242 RepID=A0A7Y3WDP5_9HYPH|nr:sugar phosphate isomerase/epimerase [Rhizobium bangladeshense]NKK72885.1 TIM barrel protein [Rhizobium leguminosarum bv. viciae]NKL37945.1 TIM barrel protein [Rhizobium leguminosarum bv. viciae]NNU36224.1 sugar phosphate isomerase/epimerase [Rhizobium sophorae]